MARHRQPRKFPMPKAEHPVLARGIKKLYAPSFPKLGRICRTNGSRSITGPRPPVFHRQGDLAPGPTNDQYPYSAAGKLFFNQAGQTYICSASLIKPGLVVTAAHCVAEFGTSSYHSDWEYHPGYRNGTSPFGAWTVSRAYVLTSYLNGTSSCQQRGVVCKDDIAVLVLNPQNNQYVGRRTGWFGVAWNGAGLTPQRITHVTQLGYPACLDQAGLMQRNDFQGALDSTHSDNTIIGSLMCGGSSGGPWVVNFGLQPALTGTQFGSSPSSKHYYRCN